MKAIDIADAFGGEPNMQRNFNTPNRRFRWHWWSLILVAVLATTACGPLGDDDNEPTATVETITQPTTAASEVPDVTPGDSGLQPDGGVATPDMNASTPVVNNPVSPQATPDQPFTVVVGTPDVPVRDVEQGATPVAPVTDSVFAGSDGTSGATPDPGTSPVSDAGTAEADETPAGDTEPEEDAATPGAKAEAVALTDLQPVTVTGCEPESVPSLNGAPANYITVTDVNFRAGPGADCDTIGTGPIGTNIPVTVLSGPVIREDDDQFVWVQVEILDQTGWLVLEVLEPAP